MGTYIISRSRCTSYREAAGALRECLHSDSGALLISMCVGPRRQSSLEKWILMLADNS